jgi:hypothetical protein
MDTAPVGIAVQRLHEVARLHKDKVHFVHAESLTNNPQATMSKVWEYMGMDPIIHNVSNIEQYTHEHELGWPHGDHSVRSEVTPLVPDWDKTLGRNLSEGIHQKFNWIQNL